jgi:hypothetical protein
MELPYYYFMPLDSHFDRGYGVIGDAYLEAADELAKVEANEQRLHAHLPTNYLYRHAVELYLKSMIVMMHTAFEISTNTPAPKPPRVLLHGKSWRFDKVHTVGGLWDCLNRLMKKHKVALQATSNTNWSELEECEPWLNEIDAVDLTGTLQKYPTSGNEAADRQKASFKPMTDELLNNVLSSGAYVKALVLENADGSSNSYMLDSSPTKELRETILQCVKLLSNAHFGMRCELGKGR